MPRCRYTSSIRVSQLEASRLSLISPFSFAPSIFLFVLPSLSLTRSIYDTKDVSSRPLKKDKREYEREKREPVSRCSLRWPLFGKADCLFVGKLLSCAHKQVETNNILAALREGVDGGRVGRREGGLGRDGYGAQPGCPRATVTRWTSAANLPSLMVGLGPTRPPSLSFVCFLVSWNLSSPSAPPHPLLRYVHHGLQPLRRRTELEIEELRLIAARWWVVSHAWRFVGSGDSVPFPGMTVGS